MNVEGFVNPRRSTSSDRPQPKASDWQSKAEKNLVHSNQYSVLSDNERESSCISMAHLIIQWNVRCFQANFEEITLLARRCKPAVAGLQETFLTHSKSPSFTGFSILTKTFAKRQSYSLTTRIYLEMFTSTLLCRRWLRR